MTAAGGTADGDPAGDQQDEQPPPAKDEEEKRPLVKAPEDRREAQPPPAPGPAVARPAPPAEPLADYCPGMLLERLLLGPGRCRSPGESDSDGDDRGDDDHGAVTWSGGEEEQPGRGRSRSRGRRRRRPSRSASPQPKKMPRAHRPAHLGPFPAPASAAGMMSPVPKMQGPLLLRAKASPPQAPEVPRPRRPAAAPAIVPWPPLAPAVVPPPLAGSPLAESRAAGERWGMQVLARHSARLGPAGAALEGLVQQVLAQAQGCCGQAAVNLVERWDFLARQDGMAAYSALRQRFTEVFDRAGRGAQADREVLGLFSGSAPPGIGAPPPSWVLPPERDAPWPPPSRFGLLLELPTGEVRFAHNDQSERFGKGPRIDPEGGCVLQLALELLAGFTRPEDVPEFSVCWHEGRWFCRSGNRRLAAFRLACRFAPERFGRVRVRVVATDEAFTHGINGRRPKLTTHQNGEHCCGRWLVIRETGELVGSGGRPGATAYGADLLSLLPPLASASPPPPPSAWAVS